MAGIWPLAKGEFTRCRDGWMWSVDFRHRGDLVAARRPGSIICQQTKRRWKLPRRMFVPGNTDGWSYPGHPWIWLDSPWGSGWWAQHWGNWCHHPTPYRRLLIIWTG